jgi:5'-3' exonuclease
MSEAKKIQMAEWSRDSKTLAFVCKNTMVVLNISSVGHREVPISQIEDLARTIISKL